MFLLVLPAFFMDFVFPNVKMLSFIHAWSHIGSGIIGFIGYDFLKLFEKSGVAILGKLGVKI